MEGWKVQTKNAKKSILLKVYFLHFLGNTLQNFTESLLLNFKKIEYRIFFFLKNCYPMLFIVKKSVDPSYALEKSGIEINRSRLCYFA